MYIIKKKFNRAFVISKLGVETKIEFQESFSNFDDESLVISQLCLVCLFVVSTRIKRTAYHIISFILAAQKPARQISNYTRK